VEVFEQVEIDPETESREVQMENFTSYFGDLYKLSNMLTPNAAELLGKLKEAEPLLEEFAEILGGEGEAVALTIRDMIKAYSQHENIEPLRGQLKKDILNKIIRKLPESIAL
jgi:translation initiation factor 2 alpha subunit (eIF-2alpha)